MPGCRRIKVRCIAPESTEDSLRDFFSFCGDIRLIQLYPGAEGKPSEAIILFETESGASTAVLLDNAVVDGARIRVEAFPESPGPGSPTSNVPGSGGATIPSNSVFDEVISETLNVASSIGKSAKQLDQQYEISNKVSTAAATVTSAAYAVDEKYHVSENATQMYESAKQGAVNLDQKYKITETVNGWMGSVLGWSSQTNLNRASSPRSPSPTNMTDSMANRTGLTPPSRHTSPGKV